MRLWHKDLIEVLPDHQLLGQWRECCAIVKAIAENGTPNHILVNKICQYPPSHLYSYTHLVLDEMSRRTYQINPRSYQNFNVNMYDIMAKFGEEPHIVPRVMIFSKWHNTQYLVQCYYNLQEKYECGGIIEGEWGQVERRYLELMSNYCWRR